MMRDKKKYERKNIEHMKHRREGTRTWQTHKFQQKTKMITHERTRIGNL